MLFPTRRSDPGLYPHRHGLYFSFFHALNWQVAIGAPTTLFMQQLGADSFQLGLVVSWTFLLTPVQVIATAFLPRIGFKRLVLAGWDARAWCLLVPIGLALLAPTERVPWMIYAMTLATFCYSVVRAVGTGSMTTWIYQLVPSDIRGRYWATEQLMAGTAVVGALLCYAGLFAVLPVYRAFLVQYVVAFAAAWLASRHLHALPDVERPKIMNLEKIVTDTPRWITEPGLFRTYLWMSVPLFVLITPIAPFVTFYLRGATGLGNSSILMLTMLTYFGLMAANLVMRSRMDEIGAKPFFRLSYIVHAAIAAGWVLFLVTDGRWLILLPVLFFLQGVASGCWISANLNYLAKILPESNRALPVSIHGAVITFLGGCSPVLWGLFLKGGTDGTTLSVPVFIAFFTSLLVGCFVLLALLDSLPEKAGRADPLINGTWLIRPFRSMANLINLIEPGSSTKHPPDPPK
jgi:MFS family permease